MPRALAQVLTFSKMATFSFPHHHQIGRTAIRGRKKRRTGSALESRISPLRGVLISERITLVMARKARVEFAGAVYHVLDRGEKGSVRAYVQEH